MVRESRLSRTGERHDDTRAPNSARWFRCRYTPEPLVPEAVPAPTTSQAKGRVVGGMEGVGATRCYCFPGLRRGASTRIKNHCRTAGGARSRQAIGTLRGEVVVARRRDAGIAKCPVLRAGAVGGIHIDRVSGRGACRCVIQAQRGGVSAESQRRCRWRLLHRRHQTRRMRTSRCSSPLRPRSASASAYPQAA